MAAYVPPAKRDLKLASLTTRDFPAIVGAGAGAGVSISTGARFAALAAEWNTATDEKKFMDDTLKRQEHINANVLKAFVPSTNTGAGKKKKRVAPEDDDVSMIADTSNNDETGWTIVESKRKPRKQKYECDNETARVSPEPESTSWYDGVDHNSSWFSGKPSSGW